DALPMPPDLGGVVGHEADRPDTQVLEDLGADAVLPEIGGETQGVVGLHRIQPLILEGVGPDLVEKADAPAFLAHVDEDAPALPLDVLEGRFQLGPAVAPEAPEHL